MTTNIKTYKLTQAQFEQFSQMIYRLCGIRMVDGKQELVQSRISKRLHVLGLSDFDQYLNYLKKDVSGKETIQLIDVLTTNKTSFFREQQHFDFMREEILPNLKNRRLRIWSAACSTGEEPYSIAILLHQELKNIGAWDIKILATDISTQVLEKASRAIYEEEIVGIIPQSLKTKYFQSFKESDKTLWQVNANLRNLVKVARLNLLGKYPMQGFFDVIFCRNVMIYFDKPTQAALVSRFYDFVQPGGYLFIGHSESLIGSAGGFRYVQPAIYAK